MSIKEMAERKRFLLHVNFYQSHGDDDGNDFIIANRFSIKF